MPAYLIVRAEVADASHRDAFDHWYAQEHLPEALEKFAAVSASRGWSDVDPSLHYAFYEFPSLEAARAISTSDAIKSMIAEFDRLWDGKVVRTREVLEIKQSL